jgi:methylmalonyl-CoA mutase cobalamin-binding subunit
MGGERKTKMMPLADAGKMIAGCAAIHVAGGPLFDAPMALIREAIRAGANTIPVSELEAAMREKFRSIVLPQ